MQFLIVVRAVLLVYIILFSARIIRSWFHGTFYGKPWELLVRITDPYLAFFSRFKFLRQGMFDFTPIAAILVLIVILDLVNAIMLYGKITLGLFIGSVISAVWSGASFLLFLFLILCIIRVISLHLGKGSESSFSQVISRMTQPVINLVERYNPIKRQLTEIQYMYLAIVLLLIVRFLGRILIKLLEGFFYALPF